MLCEQTAYDFLRSQKAMVGYVARKQTMLCGAVVGDGAE